jgi:Flp pilus assembly protein TadG
MSRSLRSHRRNAVVASRRERGTVVVTACFFLIFSLGFMGIAIDFGRLFIVKTELQTAMDSCALAAAQELDSQASALTRARSAGITAANMNRVNLQSTSWDAKGQVTLADITFKDAGYSATVAPAGARYVQCQHTQAGVKMWLLQMIGLFNNDQASSPATRSVLASAVATRASSQSNCPVPVAIKPKLNGVAPSYGYQVGEWVTLFDKGGASAGEMGWYNLDGSSGASETVKELSEGGSCGTRIGDKLGTPGAQTSVNTPWNFRFGVYKNGESPSVNHPDQTGYGYTAANWKNPVPQNAFSGAPAAGSDPSAANYIAKRAAFASLADTGIDVKVGAQIAFGDSKMLNGYKTLATPGATGEHKTYGYNRRLVVAPVIDGANKVVDYVCMFMLAPMTGPNNPAQMEFRGIAGDFSAPCTTNGAPGGAAGPLVPVLVR